MPRNLRVSPFAQTGILAHALAQLGLVPLNVEQVVDDLERQADSPPVMVEGLLVSLGGMGDDRPHLQRSPQQGPGLAAVNGLELAQRSVDPLVQGLLFRLEVGHLAAHHPGRTSRLGQNPNATQGR